MEFKGLLGTEDIHIKQSTTENTDLSLTGNMTFTSVQKRICLIGKRQRDRDIGNTSVIAKPVPSAAEEQNALANP